MAFSIHPSFLCPTCDFFFSKSDNEAVGVKKIVFLLRQLDQFQPSELTLALQLNFCCNFLPEGAELNASINTSGVASAPIQIMVLKCRRHAVGVCLCGELRREGWRLGNSFSQLRLLFTSNCQAVISGKDARCHL